MKKLIVSEIIAPMVRRSGTALAAFIGGALAVTPEMALDFATAFIGLVLVSMDLAVSHLDRKGNRQEVD